MTAMSYSWQVVPVKPQGVTRKRDTRHAVALDSENNNIQVKDMVKVIDGPHSVCPGYSNPACVQLCLCCCALSLAGAATSIFVATKVLSRQKHLL